MYYANIPLLTDKDILLVTYPGSGTTWLANILVELGLPYIDGYTEELLDTDSANTRIIESASRQRTPSLEKAANRPNSPGPLRIIKTHLWPTYFESFPVRKIILLVRDGRDTVLSYYHWRLSFSEEGERGTFSEFLRRPGFNGVCPLEDWALTIQNWEQSSMLEESLILKLEECKRGPIAQVRRLLSFLNINRNESEINAAIEASTFERMRRDEESALAANKDLKSGFIMRKGTAGQWKETFSQADLTLVTGLPAEMLAHLGYETEGSHLKIAV